MHLPLSLANFIVGNEKNSIRLSFYKLLSEWRDELTVVMSSDFRFVESVLTVRPHPLAVEFDSILMGGPHLYHQVSSVSFQCQSVCQP